jgi:hypothetical protein
MIERRLNMEEAQESRSSEDSRMERQILHCRPIWIRTAGLRVLHAEVTAKKTALQQKNA